ncbi:BrnA antitoxin family protein [Variovorax sp. PBL-E5]|uniref:BrnA antitoxin family protein n=1 Tax=Variovorax sp. PBL-E5 TaxID=434014 RepID=UPI0013176202|nr:BrnA antitoxin family protein [Variovorax sp. PBL-E5]VTU33134.1 hypothetical protein E5CHR_03559 [Variovorax sp. PBL-E5]
MMMRHCARQTSRPTSSYYASAAGGQVLPRKQRVNIFLDGAVVEYFKEKAGDRGYQTLINDALKHAIDAESLETVVRKAIREELCKGV